MNIAKKFCSAVPIQTDASKASASRKLSDKKRYNSSIKRDQTPFGREGAPYQRPARMIDLAFAVKKISHPIEYAAGKIILRLVRMSLRMILMTIDEVRAAIIKTLQKVQDVSGLPCPSLAGNDVPRRVLEQFDSTVWPVATSWIAKELGVNIDNDVHVFGGKNGGPLLTISQSASVICDHLAQLSFAVAAE
jgi:hypothetical protein